MDPSYAPAYGQLASILAEQGKLAQAEATYRRLIRHQPSAAAHQGLAQILTALG